MSRIHAITFASAGILGAFADGPRDLSNYTFAQYLAEHAKSYDTTEYSGRKEIFESRLKDIVQHNVAYGAGHSTWWKAVSHFTDYTAEEFQRLRARRSGDAWGMGPLPQLATTKQQSNPDSIDWRAKGVLTPVKNQGGCGSCWAFAATETVEAHYAIATGGKPLVLAPQAMVNCVKNPHECGGTGGCQGATEELGFNLTASHGLPLEEDLPYRAHDADCKPYKAAVKATGYIQVISNDALALETALTLGPVAITVDASLWGSYGGGIYTGCSEKNSADLDHGVQAVGYSKDYWIVRNSWGPSWGEDGFIRISRASDDKTFVDTNPSDGIACKPYPKTQSVKGECGILSDSSYPTGVTKVITEVVV